MAFHLEGEAGFTAELESNIAGGNPEESRRTNQAMQAASRATQSQTDGLTARHKTD